jgi:Tol biopolymer transport system component
VDSAGAQGNGASGQFGDALSADGRFVAFRSSATNLVAGDTNGFQDVFLRDRLLGTTERVSVATGGAQGNGNSLEPALSADGRYAAFRSGATNLVAGDTNGVDDIFVRDRQIGTTVRASVATGGAQGNGNSLEPSLSADGRFVAFWSVASNLVAGDTNGLDDIFVRDRQSATSERVSVATGGAQGNAASYDPSAISADGRFVAFYSFASNLVAGDTNGFADIFVRDRQNGATARVSVATDGTQGNNASHIPSLSADGRSVAFDSFATNLVAGDTNGTPDVFVREIWPLVPGTDICQPGTGSVIDCPCANPPLNAPRGCDNSAFTGGARLRSSGAALLAFDGLVFVTDGEKPSATSIVLQGNAEAGGGLAFGQGLRCAAGTLKRLYAKAASNGSILAPNFSAGDPSVSARSAALGDTIAAGASRWYAVYYRDPLVLGGCPPTSTFNVTQTQMVTWGF